ncbi:hypothetical protein ACN6KS_26965 [Paenibacillus nitricinens]|uniref:hypothetical protein n=1 Tax=Paenibacillus nitricinens TaxID=3367691 RepID=UPI003F83C847
MFQRSEGQLFMPGDFLLPFGRNLSGDNWWVLLVAMISWAKFEEKYVKAFKNSLKGQKALPVLVALGALIIQERLGTDDRKTLQQMLKDPSYSTIGRIKTTFIGNSIRSSGNVE